MNLLAPLKRLVGYGYPAVEDTTRRRRGSTSLRSEDKELPPEQRRKLISTTRDLMRSAAIAAWAVRVHCAHIATHRFQPKTGDPRIDRQLEQLMKVWSRPQNFDVAGRHSLERMIYLAEHGRTVDGDAFLVKMSDGRVQLIESDRIRTPRFDSTGRISAERLKKFVHGIELTGTGRPVNYAVCDRTEQGSGFQLKTVLPARHVLHHAYFIRADQTRGVSPLAAALNNFRDIDEMNELAIGKAKVAQYFGVKIKREGDEALGEVEGQGEHGDQAPYKFDLGKGPVAFDLEPGDDIEFVESRTPSTEFQAFCRQMIEAALKSVDLDMALFDSSHANYSSTKMALSVYKKSAAIKQADVQDLLRQLTVWRMGLWLEDGILQVPAGMSINDLHFEWRPTGWESIDPLKDAKASVERINAGIASRQQIVKEAGGDFFEVADQLASERMYLISKGLSEADIDSTITDEEIARDEVANAQA